MLIFWNRFFLSAVSVRSGEAILLSSRMGIVGYQLQAVWWTIDHIRSRGGLAMFLGSTNLRRWWRPMGIAKFCGRRIFEGVEERFNGQNKLGSCLKVGGSNIWLKSILFLIRERSGSKPGPVYQTLTSSISGCIGF